MTGNKYNRLLVVERAENSENGYIRWKCLCDCGKYTVVRGSNLKNGSVKSCGCLVSEKVREKCGTHLQSKTILYRKWNGIIQRCENPNLKAYKDYGARGISVCDEWRNSFESFRDWAICNGYSEDLTIDRKDVNGNYEPSNCRWADKKLQAENRRNIIKYAYKGEEKSLTEWCEKLGLDFKNVYNRIFKLGWNFEKAIETPIMKSKRNMKAREKYGS